MSGLIPFAGAERRRARPAPSSTRIERSDWTPERVDELRRLKRRRLAYATIGKKLGCSKNAVCGAVHRHLKGPRP